MQNILKKNVDKMQNPEMNAKPLFTLNNFLSTFKVTYKFSKVLIKALEFGGVVVSFGGRWS